MKWYSSRFPVNSSGTVMQNTGYGNLKKHWTTGKAGDRISQQGFLNITKSHYSPAVYNMHPETYEPLYLKGKYDRLINHEIQITIYQREQKSYSAIIISLLCFRGVGTFPKNARYIFPCLHACFTSHPNKREDIVANISSPIRGSKCNVFMNHINNGIRNWWIRMKTFT